ncbi:gamma-glutamylcyclotransferase family protein [Legionella jordanis]|uniref:AIG2-like family protein n=1 Tax=Legionella jordanis TaxID=456 RepID=A0A0W0V7Y5_9GAMM|nr:gamma-glutamylcyclotransferase family protein [Legionella jordanis]KTD16227.1 AIG2-like family protein [Legionella jordanis]RMX04553.1 gamma-glutamylcyclotransferase [Legionella jordanis]VEH12315.1 AIG2-like family [Legionella jordanis]
MEKIFSYGTLQLESVQLATFSRILKGHRDFLIGFILQELRITDSYVIQVSGKEIHTILLPTGNCCDLVEGTVFELSVQELLQADRYEVEDYQRIKVNLASGESAWVYAHRSMLS